MALRRNFYPFYLGDATFRGTVITIAIFAVAMAVLLVPF